MINTTNTKKMTRSLKKDMLTVKIFPTREELGREAAIEAGNKIKEMLSQKEIVNIIFAAAPSQNEFLENLINQKGIDWGRINAFHMDEYIGLEPDAPQGFGNFLKERIFDKKPFHSVNYLNGQCKSKEEECKRYGKLLSDFPVDIVCMGIGENAHIAFNDPPVADFNDKAQVKVVELDSVCRQQQVNDGCFKSIEKVPTHALTLTIPSLTRAKYLFCMVPAKTKAQAVANTIGKEISEKYPATIMRRHPAAIMYVDAQSGALI